MRALILLVPLLSGCAAHPYAGVAADAGTTAAGLSAGFAEGNPLAVASLPLRVAFIENAKTLPPVERANWMHAISATSFGAAAANFCTILGGPVCYAIGAAVGALVWLDGSQEREWARMCEIHRQGNPGLKCEYTP